MSLVGLGFINIIPAHMAHGMIPKTLSAKPHPAHPSASPTKMCGFEHCGILHWPLVVGRTQRPGKRPRARTSCGDASWWSCAARLRRASVAVGSLVRPTSWGALNIPKSRASLVETPLRHCLFYSGNFRLHFRTAFSAFACSCAGSAGFCRFREFCSCPKSGRYFLKL